MNDAARPASPAKPLRRACCQEQTLLRDLALVNARVTREEGVAVKRAYTSQPKRKPDLPRHDASAPTVAAPEQRHGDGSAPQ